MTFVMGWPLLAIGMLTASIPILIHLLHRQRTTPLRWGAMQFLLESPLQARRRKRVEQWLLMALRVLGLFLLAWVIARPVVRNRIAASLGASSVDIAVVVDRSLSMGRSAGDHSLWEEAIGVVDSTAQRMRAGDTLSVILAEHQPRALTELPVGSRETGDLRRALHQLGPGQTDCSIPEAIATARQLLAHGHHSRKLLIVASDQQRTNWQIGDATSWRAAMGQAQNADTDICAVALSNPAAAMNVSIDGISVAPNLLGINRPAQILATIANRGAKDVSALSIRLSIDGKQTPTAQQIPTLAIGQTTTLRFEHTFTSPGSHWISVAIDLVDGSAADNSAVAGVFVWQRLPVLIIDGQLTRAGNFAAARFLTAAMQPLDPARGQSTLVQPTVVSASDAAAVNLDDYYVVVLNDVAELPPELEEKLADYAAAGHGVWIILGPRTGPPFISESLGMQHMRLARLALNAPIPAAPASPPAIDIRSPANPAVALIASSEKNALAGAVVMRWWSVLPQDGDDQIVLATGGDPLIFEHPIGSNGGRVVVWTTSADASWNNWPVMPNFVPLVNETLYHLSAPQTRIQTNGSVPAGTPLSWSGLAPDITSIDVTLPDGSLQRGRQPTFRNGRWEFQYPNTFTPGLYQLHFSPPTASSPVYFGVSIDPKELDPARLSEADIHWLSDNHFAQPVTVAQIESLVARQADATELYKPMAGLLLLILLIETALTYRMAAKAPADAAGEVDSASPWARVESKVAQR